VLNAIFVFQLNQASSALEKQLTGFHLPSATYLKNLLIEIREVQLLNEDPQTNTDVDARNTSADLLVQRYYLINENIQALMELPQQRDATAFDEPEKRLLSQYNNWLATRGTFNEFKAPPPTQRLALERFRLSVEQPYRLHLQKLRSLSITAREKKPETGMEHIHCFHRKPGYRRRLTLDVYLVASTSRQRRRFRYEICQ
jgi:hypothetical protein